MKKILISFLFLANFLNFGLFAKKVKITIENNKSGEEFIFILNLKHKEYFTNVAFNELIKNYCESNEYYPLFIVLTKDSKYEKAANFCDERYYKFFKEKIKNKPSFRFKISDLSKFIDYPFVNFGFPNDEIILSDYLVKIPLAKIKKS